MLDDDDMFDPNETKVVKYCVVAFIVLVVLIFGSEAYDRYLKSQIEIARLQSGQVSTQPSD